MKPERWQAIEELYHSASDLPDDERNSFLEAACGEDQSLLYEVESLIRHGSAPQSVLDTPAMAIMAKAMAADESKSSASFLSGRSQIVAAVPGCGPASSATVRARSSGGFRTQSSQHLHRLRNRRSGGSALHRYRTTGRRDPQRTHRAWPS